MHFMQVDILQNTPRGSKLLQRSASQLISPGHVKSSSMEHVANPSSLSDVLDVTNTYV